MLKKMLTLVIAAVPLCLVSNMSVAYSLKINCGNALSEPIPTFYGPDGTQAYAAMGGTSAKVGKNKITFTVSADGFKRDCFTSSDKFNNCVISKSGQTAPGQTPPVYLNYTGAVTKIFFDGTNLLPKKDGTVGKCTVSDNVTCPCPTTDAS